ncbi:unnamed protein product [Adineta steineri]|uniref:ADP-ribosylhydrolase ARH1 n=1 Tax=Adineta steineri TaxID=433720 RepID=A0A814GHS1_9BILA|nr:unnamed protein product [Adineta steineri]CAF3802960.1 unnamed protein product [Adineta steineri]CAF3820679.1 unnamed protein product [Adineta steineri]
MNSNNLLEQYKACMILSGVGDSLGYRSGIWQFNSNGKDIHRELYERFDQIEDIRIELPQWRVSDDTVLHLAIAQVLAEYGDRDPSPTLYSRVAKKLKEILNDLKNRHPSSSTVTAINHLSENNWTQTYSAVTNDCTAAVRSMSIGLRYSHPSEFEKLMHVSIEISRMTHTHVWGFMGGFTSALFTSYAIQQKPLQTWSRCLLEILPTVQNYIKTQQRPDLAQNMRSWSSFEIFWKEFLLKQEINIKDIEQRDEFYRQFSHAGWAGASGTDCIAIAYNSLLTCHGSWTELCKRAALHGGHGDATGCVAGALFGAIYGFENVPKQNYKNVEYHDELENVAKKLYNLRQISSQPKTKTENINTQRGECVHFTFIPADVLDNMPAFRQWRLSKNQKTKTETNVLSKLVFQGLRIN